MDFSYSETTSPIENIKYDILSTAYDMHKYNCERINFSIDTKKIIDIAEELWQWVKKDNR